jgi:tRNA A37 threonylcarbamoyladenosine modification protein TsaB
MNSKNIDILVITISSPICIGVYSENILIDTIISDGKTSDILPSIYSQISNKYDIDTIYYVNGPGSYMAIKIGYIFLKTISIVKNIPFKATSGFKFNENSPIKALGKKYFFNNNDGSIAIKFLTEDDYIQDFKLPKELDISIFTEDCLPQYNLPAVN